MVECWLPYGRTEIHLSIPIKDLLGVAEPRLGQPAQNTSEAVSESLKNLVDSRTIADIVKPGESVAIALEGTLPPQLAAESAASVVDLLSSAGASLGDMEVIIGNGYREKSDSKLLEALQGTLSQRGVRVREHTRSSQNLINVGTTSSKTAVDIDKQFVGAGARIVIGEVLLDPLTGFRGPQSTLLPGLSGMRTIEMNRSHAFEENVTPGVAEGNPVLTDALEAAHLANVDLSVNLVTDPRGRLLKAVSGSLEASWREAVSALGDSYRVEGEANPDIVVASAGGIKFDFDLYSAIWALRSVSPIVRKGATIVLVAECSEGLGAEGLTRLSHVEMLSELRRRYVLGGEAVHLIKSMLRTNKIILVTALPSYLTEPLGLTAAKTVNDALESAIGERRGRRTLVVTHGCSTLLSTS